MSSTTAHAPTLERVFTIEDILGVFANWDEIVRRAMAQKASTHDKLNALKCPTLSLREELVRHLLKSGGLGSRGTNSPIVTAVAQDPDPKIRALLAAYQHAPAGILAGFAHDPAESVRIHLAGNPSTTPAILTALAHDPAVPVVLAAAAAKALDSHERDRLAGHPLGSVRAVIARRPDLPPGIVGRLATDRVEKVVGALLQTAAKTPEILTALVALPDASLRQKLLENSECSSMAIAGFFADPERRLRDLARARNQAFTRAPSLLHPSNSAGIPAPGTPESDEEPPPLTLGVAGIYWMLDADCPSPSVFAAATNPEMPTHLRLVILARHDLPDAVRKSCLNDPDPAIRTTALASDSSKYRT